MESRLVIGKYMAYLSLGAAAAAPLHGADWGSVTIDIGRKVVAFENSRIKAVYKPWGSENVIKELFAKPGTTNIAGNCIDACASRTALTEAKVIDEQSDRITAELKWGGHTTSRITLYKDCPVIKINQVSGNSPNIVDASAGFSRYAIYGQEKWNRDPYKYRYPKCYFHTGDGHCAQQNGESVSSDNPSVLLYNNWFINGIYKSETDGIGYGRVIDSKIKIIKLLSWGGAGFEYFWNNHASYLYVVKRGAQEIIFTGKIIADWANGGEKGLPLLQTSTIDLRAGVTRPPISQFRVINDAAGVHLIRLEENGYHLVEIFDLHGSRISRFEGSGRRTYYLLSEPAGSGMRVVRAKIDGKAIESIIAGTIRPDRPF